jgi:maltooligosyltrehalose trehalohydrolase
VEVMPIAEFAGARGWGYDGAFLYAPHRAYGGPEGVFQFINACHELGLAVLLDVVYNHLGPSGNYLPQFAPYFTDRHKTPWGAAVNFDGPHSDDVREFFIDNARMWLCDYHFDGLRLDAIHAIVDTSAFPFLEQLGQEVKHLEAQLRRQLVLVAESDLNDPRIIRSHEQDGFGLHAQWNDDFHHAVHATLTNEKHGYYEDFGGVDDLACVFRTPYLYARRFSPHRLRSHGRPADRIPASSFIAYSQNHDQVGNRATGERLHHLVSPEGAKVAAALTILSPYVPMLFQGEEWAASSPFQYFVDFSDDPELAAAITAGRQKEFEDFHQGKTPDPCDPKTFNISKLNWKELEDNKHSEMLDWYKTLLQLRRRFPQLVDGRLDRVRTRFDEKNRWLVIEREGVFLIANLGATTSAIEVPTKNDLSLIIASTTDTRLDGQNVIVSPTSVCLLVAENSAQARGRHRIRGGFVKSNKSQYEQVALVTPSDQRPYQDALSTLTKQATAGSS